MIEPLSITSTVVSLLKTCVQTGWDIKQFVEATKVVDSKIKGLQSDVESFTQVLTLMSETLGQDEIQQSFQETGHIGSYWAILLTCIQDGQQTLIQLQTTIDKVHKPVTFFDATRQHLRIQGATAQITVYQQQIQSYRNTLQLSLQTIMFYYQITFHNSTAEILPNLEELHQSIRTLGVDFNKQIAGTDDLTQPTTPDNYLSNMHHLRECVQAAASVVSSASTVLKLDHVDAASDFGDLFPPCNNDAMLRWILSSTVLENIKGEVSDSSESDGELEQDILQSYMRSGKDCLESKRFSSAEKPLKNCLTRFDRVRYSSTAPLSSSSVSRNEIVCLLLTSYRMQNKWDEAHDLLSDHIRIESHASAYNRSNQLADMLSLAEILMNMGDYPEALFRGRRAFKGYRKMGREGRSGVIDSLGLLCDIYAANGDHEEEEGYKSLFTDFLTQRREHPTDWCQPILSTNTWCGPRPVPPKDPVDETTEEESSPSPNESEVVLNPATLPRLPTMSPRTSSKLPSQPINAFKDTGLKTMYETASPPRVKQTSQNSPPVSTSPHPMPEPSMLEELIREGVLKQQDLDEFSQNEKMTHRARLPSSVRTKTGRKYLPGRSFLLDKAPNSAPSPRKGDAELDSAYDRLDATIDSNEPSEDASEDASEECTAIVAEEATEASWSSRPTTEAERTRPRSMSGDKVPSKRDVNESRIGSPLGEGFRVMSEENRSRIACEAAAAVFAATTHKGSTAGNFHPTPVYEVLDKTARRLSYRKFIARKKEKDKSVKK